MAEAQKVFDSNENFELGGRVLYIDYSTGSEFKNETPSKQLDIHTYLVYLHIFVGILCP